MNRSTIAGPAAALVAAVLIGSSLVSVALAATGPAETAPTTSVVADSLHASDIEPVFDVAAEAAAAKLDVSADFLASWLAGGSSLKQLADARAVGYGTLARGVNTAVNELLAAAVARGSLESQQATEIRFAVAGWVDRGGQADTGWFGRPA
jgi:hypothetical protein